MTVVVEAGIEERPPNTSVVGQRYFEADNGGPSYTVVAFDLEHAKSILRKADDEKHSMFCDAGADAAFDDCGLEWTELDAERVARARVHGNDAFSAHDPRPLNTFGPGDWFCSEW